MKILYITDAEEKYGAATSFKEMVVTLKENYNVEPIVLTSINGELNKFLDENEIENHAIGHEAILINTPSNKIKRYIKLNILKKYYKNKILNKNMEAIKKAGEIVDFDKIDLIHTNVNRIDIGIRLAKKYHIPHIMHLREFSDLDFNLAPVTMSYKKFYGFMNEYTNSFIAISNVIKENFIKKGIDKDKIRIIYNGISNYDFIDKNRFDDNKTHIVMTSSIGDTKGQMDAVRAINLLKDDEKRKIKFDIYGDGDKKYIGEIKNYINKNKLNDIIELKGYSNNINSIIGKYDIGLMCSKSEAFGRVTAEYMNAGLIVIASNTGANPEIINDNQNGYLYNKKDVRTLTEQIEKIINNDINKNIEIRKNAINKVKNNFTKEINAKNVYNLYKEILEKRSNK